MIITFLNKYLSITKQMGLLIVNSAILLVMLVFSTYISSFTEIDNIYLNIFNIISILFLSSISILLHLNIKYYIKYYNIKKDNFIDDCINVKCTNNFQRGNNKYIKGEKYDIEIQNGHFMIIHSPTDEYFPSDNVDVFSFLDIINRFDFDTKNEKRKKKLQKLSSQWL